MWTLTEALAINPNCPKGIIQWQHGSFKKLDNGSLSLDPIKVDGRQVYSDPCSYGNSIYTRYNTTELFKVCASSPALRLGKWAHPPNVKLTEMAELRSCHGRIHEKDTVEPLQAGWITAHATLLGLLSAPDAPNHDPQPPYHFNRRCKGHWQGQALRAPAQRVQQADTAATAS